MSSPLIPKAVCPVCGTEASGRFCANCGATLSAGKCAGCETPLSPGAHFCHRCGKPVGTAISPPAATQPEPKRAAGISSSLPWAIAAVALLALLAMSAGKFFNASKGSSLDAPANALPQAGLDDRGQRGPDISALSPQEQADRLFNRVMLLNTEGKKDSVMFFAPMAISAYEMLSPLNQDQRYDLGRIAEVAGALPLAKAQADTILQSNPNHLLGLILASRIATLSGDASAGKKYQARFVAAEKSERARKLPEYDRHQNDIDAALADARRSTTNKK